MTKAPALVECIDLYKSYEGTFESADETVEVLRGVSLSVAAGEMVAIVGVSGVGKTTLLYVLGLLEQPTSGQVLYGGQDIFAHRREAQLAEFRNREIGFVFQFHHLIPEFSVLENVMMPTIIAGWPRSKGREAALKIMTHLGIEHRASHKPGEVSGGEQQRAAVARSMVMNPKLVLADEPTGNLDKVHAEMMYQEFVRLNEIYGTTFVIVTHNEELAAKMHRVVHLSEGMVQANS
ncbi:MAG: ABC transporter ATP-binding protein [Deltaproteobacteria bacterium]|nr:ABC transporter ATP-binding protein [Deltaproteobacteria bacterium]MCB9487443.1 ABC transporter ATP-binding protein [Deltaproteobacteria bacterium]